MVWNFALNLSPAFRSIEFWSNLNFNFLKFAQGEIICARFGDRDQWQLKLLDPVDFEVKVRGQTRAKQVSYVRLNSRVNRWEIRIFEHWKQLIVPDRSNFLRNIWMNRPFFFKKFHHSICLPPSSTRFPLTSYWHKGAIYLSLIRDFKPL